MHEWKHPTQRSEQLAKRMRDERALSRRELSALGAAGSLLNLPHAWVRWSLPWRPPAPGDYELLACASDQSGATQPDAVPFNQGGYQYWAVVRHPVTVV